MRIAHLSDIHIRLKDRHSEYKTVFETLYTELKNQKPDRILLAGDIVHSKIALSPELVSMAIEFIRKLSTIAPVDLIVGNHDMNMSNMDRMDALSPIVDSASWNMASGQINYMKDTGLYEFAPGFVYGAYSLLDGKDLHLRKKDKEDGKVYIALYHGPVAGCKLDNEYMMSEASTSISTFANFDFAFLGDIHRRQFLNEKKTIAYCGSLIQQNHKEDLDKGFLMWDIKSPKDFSVEFIKIYNEYAYYTINADNGELPDLDLPPKTRIRVIWAMNSKDISRAEATRLNSLIREKYNPYSVQLSFKPIKESQVNGISLGDSVNLADPTAQRDLLKKWIINRDPDIDVDSIVEIDKSITDSVTNNEFEDFSNSVWSLNRVTMENFMSYAGPVEIDFKTMKGVIGLFGDNTAGKSVIIDAILYALFNKTTRNVKNEDLVNKYTDNDVCKVILEMEIRGIEYEIERWTTRQYKKRSGEFINARTDVILKRRYNSEEEWENLSETERKETEKIIRNSMGEFEDFLITTLSTQSGGNEFLNLRAALRSDAVLKYLGLDIFNKKYDYAKDILKEVESERRAHTKGGQIEFLDTKLALLEKYKGTLNSIDNEIKKTRENISEIQKRISSHQRQINNTITIEKDTDTITSDIQILTETIEFLKIQESELIDKCKELLIERGNLEKLSISVDELIELKKKVDKCNKLNEAISTSAGNIEYFQKVLLIYKDDFKMGNGCPVSDDKRHVTCNFLKGYMEKKDKCLSLMKNLKDSREEHEKLFKEYESQKHVITQYSEYEKLMREIERVDIALDKLKSEISNVRSKIEAKTVSLNLSNSQLQIVKKNEEIIRSNKENRKAIESLQKELTKLEGIQESNQNESKQMASKIAVLDKEISDIKEIIERIRESDEQHKLYSVYCDAMHRNGLPVDVLRTFLPTINYEINKILSDVVDFGVYFKIDDGETDIEIVMRYDGDIDNTRPAQMASGMEKLLINMAIRYALLSVSNLNKPSSWFIDEGFGVLDSDNLYSMSKFFDNVKSVFRNIVIITHIDTLKDVADFVVNIEKENGISKVSAPIKNI